MRITDSEPYSPLKRFLLNQTPYGWLNQNSHLFMLAKDQQFVSLSIAHLRRLVAAASSVPLLVVWIPMREEVFPLNPEPPTVSLMTEMREAIRQSAHDDGTFKFVDTVKHIQRGLVPPRASMYLSDRDAHFSTVGNAWFADLVYPSVLPFMLGLR